MQAPNLRFNRLRRFLPTPTLAPAHRRYPTGCRAGEAGAPAPQNSVEVVEALSEEDLFDPDLYEWTSEQSPLWMYVAHNTYLHYCDHIGHVREWLADSQ